jgi:hypothetical protein
VADGGDGLVLEALHDGHELLVETQILGRTTAGDDQAVLVHAEMSKEWHDTSVQHQEELCT